MKAFMKQKSPTQIALYIPKDKHSQLRVLTCFADQRAPPK